jgi:tetratricopeptide (TPR) repeat protein
VRNLYRLTGLGEPAMQAIEQAQRIARAGGDYERIGLCEFHVGLIYLHYDRVQGAAHRFAAAARQWSFINATASVCLAFFAEGKAEEFSYRYETALICYNKASQWLERIQYEPDSHRWLGWGEWSETLRAEIGAALRKVRRILRNYPADREKEAAAETAPPAETTSPQRIVLPAPATSPVPGHPKETDEHHWYRITERVGAFLDFLPQGTWLLVRVAPRLHYDHGDLLVVGGEDSLNGSITVHSRSHRPSFARIRLARVPLTGAFTRNGDRVNLHLDSELDHTFQPDAIVGLVVGVWLEQQRLKERGG